MDTARWSQVREILEAALEHEPPQRERFVDRACGGDGDLAREVRRLLANDDAAHDLEPPADGWPATRGEPVGGIDGSIVGARVGRYRILRLIGNGGMGAVYEAEQEQPRRTVALKVMSPNLCTPDSLRRFEFESQVLARLRHPLIAAVFEAGTHHPDPADPSRAVPYFAMELVQGAAPITDFARARGLSARERLELFAQVCDAVHHGHQHAVIHRDLKPGNVLVDAEGRPRIIDFGIARTLEPDASATHGAGQPFGTLQYMSPEQCALGSEGIDTRSDVYSLGVMLYELLADRVPYEVAGASISEAIRRVREVDPPPLGEVDRSLRGDVQIIVRAAMEKDRDNRYAAAASLAADIRRHLRSEPIAARPPTAMYHLRVFARRNKPLVAAAAIVLIVLVAGIVATSLAWRSSRDEARRAQRIANFYKDTITTGIPYLPGNVAGRSEWWETPPEPFRAASSAPRSLAVPELLEVAGSRLEEKFADEPRIQADLYDTLGRTLTYMGHSSGMDLLTKAIEIREREFGPYDPDAIRSRLAYATRLEGGGNFAGAEEQFRRALEASLRAFGADDPRTIAVECTHAACMRWLDPGRGLALISTAVEHARLALGDDDRATLSARDNLASAVAATGDLDRAEALEREALAGWRRVAGEESLEAAQSRVVLSELLLSRRSYKESEALLRAGLLVIRERFGGDIVHTLNWDLVLVRLLRHMARNDEAAAEMRRILESARAAFGDENAHVSKLEAMLARILLESGRDLEEAESVARHAARELEDQIGKNDLNTVFAIDTLHGVIRARGRASEAAALAAELLHDADARGIVDPQVLSVLHQTLGECRLDCGDLTTAVAELSHAWKLAEDGAAYPGDPYHPRRRALIAALARADDALGRSVEAAAWRARLAEPGR